MPQYAEHVNQDAYRTYIPRCPQFPENDEIVIAGLSGRLPESDSIEEFRENLLMGNDMVTENERRWTPGMYGLPKRQGKVKTLNKFDATFFGIHAKQVNSMDAQQRLILETAYESIVDAGVNPKDLRGSKTGVFVGVSASETDDALLANPETMTGYSLPGCQRGMFANRVSFIFDFKGPSFAVDTACSSAMFAFDQAMTSMRTGQCDAAIVVGSNLCLKPATSVSFHRLGMLAVDGSCKAFDASGNGYVRSEAVVSIFLQKSSDAKRIYASVIHSKTNADGWKEQGVTYPSGQIQKQLLQEIYAEAGVNPADVAYVEAHGTGTKVGDPEEVNSIADVFCKGRAEPLLIGSVKSNMGHSEAASGMCSLAKVLIAMEDGYIPANLHFKSPNTSIPALSDGRLKVVSERTKWNGGLVGINSFGFGGANAHVILKSNPRKPDPNPTPEPSKLFLYSGRTEESVDTMLNYMEQNGADKSLYGLLSQNSASSPNEFHYRGYTVLNHDKTVREIKKGAAENRPIWYVYSGMGSHWTGLAKDMMKFEVFATSMRKTAEVLKPYGMDLIEIVTSDDPKYFDDILNCFVAISATQIALTDMLTALGIEPDGMIGHSAGELGCAYGDGAFTA
jgi:fatty acid synthase